MQIQSFPQHCDRCGASIRPTEEECHHCGQPSRDPDAGALADRISREGASAIESTCAGGGCSSVAMAGVLVQCLKDPALAPAAIKALKSITDPAVLNQLLALFAHHRWLGHAIQGNWIESPPASSSIPGAVRQSFSLQDPARAAVLLAALKSSDAPLREAAADLLQYQPAPEVKEALAQAVRLDRDPQVRARAVRALGQWRDASLVGILSSALHDDASSVQSQAAQALSRIGSGSAVQAAAETLGAGEPKAAFHSAQLLAQMANSEAIEALIDTFKNRRDLSRLYASQALAQLGDCVLEPLLETLIRNADSVGVRDGVAYVLRTMRLPPRERDIVDPVVHAAERLNAGLEVPGAAYEALGRLRGVSTDELRRRLGEV